MSSTTAPGPHPAALPSRLVSHGHRGQWQPATPSLPGRAVRHHHDPQAVRGVLPTRAWPRQTYGDRPGPVRGCRRARHAADPHPPPADPPRRHGAHRSSSSSSFYSELVVQWRLVLGYSGVSRACAVLGFTRTSPSTCGMPGPSGIPHGSPQGRPADRVGTGRPERDWAFTRRHIAVARGKDNTMLIAQRPCSARRPSRTTGRDSSSSRSRRFRLHLGNSLRRTLLSSIPGAAVTSIRVDGVLHEFQTIPGSRRISSRSSSTSSASSSHRSTTSRSSCTCAAGASAPPPRGHRPAGRGRGAQPDLHIATLSDKARLEMGHRRARSWLCALAQQNKDADAEIGRIPVDSI